MRFLFSQSCRRFAGTKSMSLGSNGNLKIKQVNWHHWDWITHLLECCWLDADVNVEKIHNLNPMLRVDVLLMFVCVVICSNDFPGNLMYFRLNNGTQRKKKYNKFRKKSKSKKVNLPVHTPHSLLRIHLRLRLFAVCSIKQAVLCRCFMWARFSSE